ncbi:Protein CBG12486 [Caenorhabditis briggsae]|uniref:Protein CBG12486 n=1 Tax=Caenorhabditis briggsae TaxID=6238 RepID=A8XFV7_CAEBR|nr:Protein CBG12486 [Caenorhabditis briggsae]CAP31461.2 Protein CBG12486 [Caenorhabditis briggsae]
MTVDDQEFRFVAGGDVFETNDKILRIGSGKHSIFYQYYLHTSICKLLIYLVQKFKNSVWRLFRFYICTPDEVKNDFWNTSNLYGEFGDYSAKISYFIQMISLGNTLFRMFVGLNDGDWFERCFGESIDTFHSVITILYSIFQVFISFILVRMSFWFSSNYKGTKLY